MTSKSPAPSREERLATKLRENLRRRKVQARTIESAAESPTKNASTASENIHEDAPQDGETRALSKEQQKS